MRLLYECPAETRLTVYRRFSILTLGEIAWAWDRAHLVHWTSDLKFNWYFAFWLQVLLHSNSFKCIEVSFCVSISLFARPNLNEQPEGANSKKLIFLVDFLKKSLNFRKLFKAIIQFWKWHVNQFEKIC